MARINAVLRRAGPRRSRARCCGAPTSRWTTRRTSCAAPASRCRCRRPSTTCCASCSSTRAGCVSKPQILDHVWQYDFGGDGGVVETYIGYLRKKVDSVEPRLIQTIRGFGLHAAGGTVGRDVAARPPARGHGGRGVRARRPRRSSSPAPPRPTWSTGSTSSSPSARRDPGRSVRRASTGPTSLYAGRHRPRQRHGRRPIGSTRTCTERGNAPLPHDASAEAVHARRTGAAVHGRQHQRLGQLPRVTRPRACPAARVSLVALSLHDVDATMSRLGLVLDRR